MLITFVLSFTYHYLRTMELTNFLSDIIGRFKYYKKLGDQSFEQLPEADMHFRPSSESNSIALILQHLYGNMMSRFTDFLTEDGEKPWRKRDAEFEPMDLTKRDLLDFWETGWSTLLNTLESLKPEDLTKEISIRSEKLFVYDAILRQLAHYPYHVGQIVLIAKMIRNQDWKSLSISKGESKTFEQQVRSGDNLNGMGSGKIS